RDREGAVSRGPLPHGRGSESENAMALHWRGGFGLRGGGRSRGSREGEGGGGAGAGLRGGPDAAGVAVDDFSADGQADASSGQAMLGLKLLEDFENALAELGVEADAVVGHGDMPLIGLADGRHVDPAGRSRTEL